MQIELKWLDPNPAKRHKTEIYRSQSPFYSVNDATLIATVNPGFNTYLDGDVKYGELYYYRFVLRYNESVSPMSPLFAFHATPYTGPGPSITRFGDEKFGYFGNFQADHPATPSFNMVRQLLGLPEVTDPNLKESILHKFAIGGSIRGIFTSPICIGEEIDRNDQIMQLLMDGGIHRFSIGLHDWAIALPSATRRDSTDIDSQHLPGELRSMLGVVTELYTRVEDVETGNRTGGRLTVSNGLSKFYEPLANRYPDKDIKHILSSDWVNNECNVISWTPEVATYPLRSKEMFTQVVDINQTEWNNILIWPILIYTGLMRPTRNE